MDNLIEGRNPVLEALRSGRPIGKIFLAGNIERHSVIGQIIHLAQERNIPLEYVERAVIARMSSGVSQGVLALAAAREYAGLDDLLAIPGNKNEMPFLVVLDGIEDPHNLGAILRSADGAGAHGVIIREKRAVGLTAAVEKASAGAAEYMPVARVSNITQTIQTLKQNNIWVAGIDQSGDIDYTRIDYRPPTAVVVGGEGQGLSELVKKSCDFLAFIPMKGKISSLNASVAAAIVMYEVVRQRTMQVDPLHGKKEGV